MHQRSPDHGSGSVTPLDDDEREQARAHNAGRALARVMIQEGCGNLQEIEWEILGSGEVRGAMMLGARSEWSDFMANGERLGLWTPEPTQNTR